MTRPPAAPAGVGGRLALRLLPRLNLFALIARSPGLLWPFLAYGAALHRRNGLDPALRELVILRVAHNEDSAYERQHHLGLARAAGVPDRALEAVALRPLPTDAFDLTSLAALQLADRLAHGPAPQEDAVEEAHDRLGPAAVTDVVLLAGHYTAIARLIRCHGLAPDSPRTVRAAQRAHHRLDWLLGRRRWRPPRNGPAGS